MTIEGRDDKRGRRIRLGMVGGGQGAFIGAVHRMAARIDDRFELVAGALSSSPEKARASAAEIGLDASRSYDSYEDMAKSEKAREDGIEAVHRRAADREASSPVSQAPLRLHPDRRNLCESPRAMAISVPCHR